MKGKLSCACIATLVLLTGARMINAADPPYHLITEIKIGGGGFWDYLSVDAENRRLYVMSKVCEPVFAQ